MPEVLTSTAQEERVESTKLLADLEYDVTNDMDIELTYLEKEFSKFSDPEYLVNNTEDYRAALDLLGDFCDAHNLDRTVEKQLRERLSSGVISNQENSVSNSNPKPDTLSIDTKTSDPKLEVKSDTTEQSIQFVEGSIVQLIDEKGEVHTGKITSIEQDDESDTEIYIITNEQGTVFKANAEDLTLLNPDTSSIRDDKPTTTSEVPKAGTSSDQAPRIQNTTDELSIKEKILAKTLVIAEIIKQKKNEAVAAWQEAPKNKKIIFGIGAGALLLASAYILKENISLFDSTELPTTGSETPLAGGPDAIDISGGVAESSTSSVLTSAQKEFAESYANTPWQAAVDSYGSDNAADALKSAVEKAQAAGENIRTSGEGSSWKIQANGSWNTQEVTKVLAEYMPKK